MLDKQATTPQTVTVAAVSLDGATHIVKGVVQSPTSPAAASASLPVVAAQHVDREHAILAPSAAERWMVCAGQPFLSKGIPNVAGEAALWGTHCHEMSEPKLRAFFAGQAMVFDDIEDFDKREVVEAYCRFVTETIYPQFVRGLPAGSYAAYVEEKVEIYLPDVKGTADFILVREVAGRRDACLVDLKTGFHDVTVPENKQFANYSVGLARKFKINGSVIAFGFLPRVESRQEPWEKWVLTAEDITAWEQKIVAAADKAMQIYRGEREPEYAPGKHCKWCPAQGKCFAYQRQLDKEADGILSQSPLVQLPPVHGLTPEQKARILGAKDLIEKFLESVESLALADLEAGYDVPGFKLVNGQTRRAWIKGSEEQIALQLQQRGVENPWQRKLITLGEAEKKISKENISDLVEPTKAKLLIVPENDKRPRVTSSAVNNNLLTNL